jgi:plasmid maintenance system killer protein
VELLFVSDELKALYIEGRNTLSLPSEVIDLFFYHLAAIVAAEKEEDLLRLRSLSLRLHHGDYFIDLGEDWVLTLSLRAIPTKTVFVSMHQNILESAS